VCDQVYALKVVEVAVRAGLLVEGQPLRRYRERIDRSIGVVSVILGASSLTRSLLATPTDLCSATAVPFP
jgi:hypothetical protein